MFYSRFLKDFHIGQKACASHHSTASRYTHLRGGALLLILAVGLSGCSSITTSSFPLFGLGSRSSSHSPDCVEIEKRMSFAHKKYATALRREKPALYLTFTGQLSRTMVKNRLGGIHEMTDLHLDGVVHRTQDTCVKGNHARSTCRGANRLGQAYKPLVLAARQAHENYCGNRPIR